MRRRASDGAEHQLQRERTRGLHANRGTGCFLRTKMDVLVMGTGWCGGECSEPDSPWVNAKVAAVILTTKEAQHLRRGIAGLATVANEIVVLNRASIDGTIQIALEAGGGVIQRDGVNRATQFNLALSDLNVVTGGCRSRRR